MFSTQFTAAVCLCDLSRHFKTDPTERDTSALFWDTGQANPDRKGLIKIISTRYFLVIKEINKYLVDMILINYFRSGLILYQVTTR
jgi:hypothetical protein